MKKIRVGITGQSGFVGTNLYEKLKGIEDKYECIPFERDYWCDDLELRKFVRQCDMIFHLACLVRSSVPGEVYDTNILLGNKLVNAMIEEGVYPCLLFASSVQEFDDSEYARCKRETREQISNWARQHNTGFAGLIFPNLFGQHARPNSHSFIATFCYKLIHGEQPQIIVDNNVSLKYIDNLVSELVKILEHLYVERFNKTIRFAPDFTMKVSEVLTKLEYFKKSYVDENKCPIISSSAEEQLFLTFKSYITSTL